MKHVAPALALVGALHAGSAHAYPQAVIFAPSGEARSFGEASLITYTAYLDGSPLTWAGMNLGVLPAFAYGASGLSFGGLELGFDVISMAGLTPAHKPVFNAKAQLLKETEWAPSLALGLSDLAPSAMATSLNATYAAASKTLAWGALPLGRVTLGGGVALTDAPAVFAATAPFSGPSKGFLMGGYETPTWGPASLAADHVGGVSELGSTNLALNVLVTPGTTLGLGYTMGNDRAITPADAFYFYVSSGWKLLSKEEK
jgi:hypothetical protein